MSRVWKVSPLGRIGSVLAAAVAVAALFVARGPAFGVVALLVLGVGVWRFAFWPAVILRADEVEVRNPWGTRRVPLSDVAGTGGAYAGLSIERHSGGPVNAWAVQKSNLAKWTGKATRADEAAAAILAAR
jgi:hypothetical protein